MYKQIDVMSSNSFRCRYTAEEAYNMLNKDSAALEPEEEAQEDIATVPTSIDEPPRSHLLIVNLLPTMTMIYQAMSSNYSFTQVAMM